MVQQKEDGGVDKVWLNFGVARRGANSSVLTTTSWASRSVWQTAVPSTGSSSLPCPLPSQARRAPSNRSQRGSQVQWLVQGRQLSAHDQSDRHAPSLGLIRSQSPQPPSARSQPRARPGCPVRHRTMPHARHAGWSTASSVSSDPGGGEFSGHPPPSSGLNELKPFSKHGDWWLQLCERDDDEGSLPNLSAHDRAQFGKLQVRATVYNDQGVPKTVVLRWGAAPMAPSTRRVFDLMLSSLWSERLSLSDGKLTSERSPRSLRTAPRTTTSSAS